MFFSHGLLSKKHAPQALINMAKHAVGSIPKAPIATVGQMNIFAGFYRISVGFVEIRQSRRHGDVEIPIVEVALSGFEIW